MTKLISLTDEAYAVLYRLKLEKESFSKLVLRLFGEKKADIMDSWGAWADWPEADKIFSDIIAKRHRTRLGHAGR